MKGCMNEGIIMFGDNEANGEVWKLAQKPNQ